MNYLDLDFDSREEYIEHLLDNYLVYENNQYNETKSLEDEQNE